MNQYSMFFCSNLHTTSEHATEKFAQHGRCCMQNSQLQTKYHIELEDSSRELLKPPRLLLMPPRS